MEPHNHSNNSGFHYERNREPLTGFQQRSDSISLLFLKDDSGCRVQSSFPEGKAGSRENVWEVSTTIR